MKFSLGTHTHTKDDEYYSRLSKNPSQKYMTEWWIIKFFKRKLRICLWKNVCEIEKKSFKVLIDFIKM